MSDGDLELTKNLDGEWFAGDERYLPAPEAADRLGKTAPTLLKNCAEWGIQVRDRGEPAKPRWLYREVDVERAAGARAVEVAEDVLPAAELPADRQEAAVAPGSSREGSGVLGTLDHDLGPRVRELEAEVATLKAVIENLLVTQRANVDSIALLIAPSSLEGMSALREGQQ